jgi:hypothetical protein
LSMKAVRDLFVNMVGHDAQKAPLHLVNVV